MLRLLEAWHIKSLRFILGVIWRNKLKYEEIYRMTGSVSLESQLGRRQLRWTGHVIRMDENRLPKQVLYGELSTGKRRAGGQKKRHKIKSRPYSRGSKLHLKCWRRAVRTAVVDPRNATRAPKNTSRVEMKLMRLRRQRRHQQDLDVEDRRFPCTTCGRVCLSLIGLQSHLTAHHR